MDPAEKKKVGIILSKETLIRLRRVAAETFRSQSEIIETALQEYLDRLEKEDDSPS